MIVIVCLVTWFRKRIQNCNGFLFASYLIFPPCFVLFYRRVKPCVYAFDLHVHHGAVLLIIVTTVKFWYVTCDEFNVIYTEEKTLKQIYVLFCCLQSNKKLKGMRRNYSESSSQKMLYGGAAHTDSLDSTCSCPSTHNSSGLMNGDRVVPAAESYSVSSYKTCNDSFTASSTPHSSPGSQETQDAKPKRWVIVHSYRMPNQSGES